MHFPERTDFQAHADWLVWRGEELCAEQAALIARWRTLGHETEQAEAMLVRLEQSLTVMCLYRARLEADAQGPTP